MGLYDYLGASFVEGLGGIIPTKTSRAVAQFLLYGVLVVIISDQVFVTRFLYFSVRLIFFAVILSS